MKKRVFAALLLACVSICGCSANRHKQADSGEDLSPIIVGCAEYVPFTDIDGSGEFFGLDIDLAREAFHRLGYEPVFQKITWENKRDFLENDTVDCIWSGFIMEEEDIHYTWAGPYLCSQYTVLVAADSGIETLEDLEGKRIAIQAETKIDEFLSEAGDRDFDVGKVYTFSTISEVFQCLKEGYVDAISGHEITMEVFAEENSDLYRELSETICSSQLGVAFKKGTHTELAESLTETFDEMKQDGTMRTIIEQYGFDADKMLEGESYD